MVRFSHKEQHQLVLEPEGPESRSIYLNGLSNSMPEAIQLEMVRAIPGLERAELLRPGYAIEYDFVPPEQLRPSLETRAVRGLYHAGQVNGTSGYEEAAAQGLIAGINAVLGLAEKGEPLVLGRAEAYAGVLVDDLVTLGTARAVPHVHLPGRAPAAAGHRHRRSSGCCATGHGWVWCPGRACGGSRRARSGWMRPAAPPAFAGGEAGQRAGRQRCPRPSGSGSPGRPAWRRCSAVPGPAWTARLSPLEIEPLAGLNRQERRRLYYAIKYEGYIERETREAGKAAEMEGAAAARGARLSLGAQSQARGGGEAGPAAARNLRPGQPDPGVTPADLVADPGPPEAEKAGASRMTAVTIRTAAFFPWWRRDWTLAGVSDREGLAGRLAGYCAMVRRFRRAAGLTAERDDRLMTLKMAIEPLLALRFLSATPRTLLDVGSGAGSPGIALAAANPVLDVTMLEPDRRKSVFIGEAIRTLELPNAADRAHAPGGTACELRKQRSPGRLWSPARR